MDQVTASLLRQFSADCDLVGLPESKQFEHFASYAVIRKDYSAIFDTDNVVVGDDRHDVENDSGGHETSRKPTDTGIDGIGIIVNGRLITDVDELEDLEQSSYWEVVFVFVQAETSPGFDHGKLLRFGQGCLNSFATLRGVDAIRQSQNLLKFERLSMITAQSLQRAIRHVNCAM